MDNNRFDFVIAGGGAVGLTAAMELKKRRPGARVAVFEKEIRTGLHASGRNSGVLHSGIYYPPSSLKAQVCSRGAMLMRQFALQHGIPISQKGKLIVAAGEQDLSGLRLLAENAQQNKVRFEWLDEAGVRQYEPQARTHKAALYVSDTAVIDSVHAMRQLTASAEAGGVELRVGEPILEVRPGTKEFRIPQGIGQYHFFLNCAGAHADRMAKPFGLGEDYKLVPFKGLYYKLRPERQHWIHSNIYPVPDPQMPFLGIHFTRQPSGDVYVGPTAIPALGRENYGLLRGIQVGESIEVMSMLAKMIVSKDPTFRRLVQREIANYVKPVFFRRAKKLVPELEYPDLVSCSKVGIRPQLVNLKTGKLEMDYVLEETPSSLHVLNAISPAFTSAFAFAEVLADRILKNR